MEKNKISITQMVLLLFLSRVFTALTYSPGMNQTVSGTAMLFGQLIGYGVVLLLFAPLVCMAKRYPERSLVMNVQALSDKGSLPIHFIYFAYLILLGINTLAQFQLFMINAIFQEASVWAILLPMLAVAVYAAYTGIEGIARSGFLLFVVFLVAFLFIILSSVPEISLIRLKPLEQDGISQVLRGAYGVVSRSVELVLLYLLLPYLQKGKLGKGILSLTFLSLAAFELIAFFLLTVLGDFSIGQTFPFYTLASMSGISIFQRMDALYMGIWVFVAFVRLSLLIFLATELLTMMLPIRFDRRIKRNWALGLVAVLVLVLTLPVCYNRQLLTISYRISYAGILLLVLGAVIPLITLLILKLKSKRRGAGCGND